MYFSCVLYSRCVANNIAELEWYCGGAYVICNENPRLDVKNHVFYVYTPVPIRVLAIIY